MRARSLALVVSLAGALALGCRQAAPRDPAVAALMTRLADEGVASGDPRVLTEHTIAEVRAAVGVSGAPIDRLQKLDGWLRNGQGEFRYDADPYLDVQHAYDERRGDCLAYALLFGTLARAVGVPIHYLHASEIMSRGERDGWFYAASHVAVGLGNGPRMAVFDFTSGRITSSELTPFVLIDDATVLALRYSNIAVDWLAHNKTREAERLLAALAELAPDVPEPINNLGVARTRLGRGNEALALLEFGLTRFPDYAPLYTNAIRAAVVAGDPVAAHAIEEAGSEVAENDPSFVFARGLRLFRNQAYGAAAAEFERAVALSPKSPVLQAWRARAYLSAGDTDLGRSAFEAARALAPDPDVLRELETQFPVLRADMPAAP